MDRAIRIDQTESSTLNCPSCNTSHSFLQAFERGEVDFGRCPNCQLLFRKQFPTSGELAAIYAQHYQDENISQGRTMQETEPDAVNAYATFVAQEFAGPSASVLDYGAGTGLFVQKLRERGFEAEGVEFSAAARAYARVNRGIDIHEDTAQLDGRRFDLITLIEVIEHLTNPASDLSHLRILLRPEGKLFITTPNSDGVRARMERGAWREATKAFHLMLFNKRSLYACLKRAGFTQIDFVRFSPIQKSGLIAWTYGRTCQALGLPGTICAVAQR